MDCFVGIDIITYLFICLNLYLYLAKNKNYILEKNPTMHGDVETDKPINSIKVKTKY